MTKISRQKLKFRTGRIMKKLSIKRMNWSVCDESSSSSDDDNQPILPSPSSSGNLSTIEESHLENGVDSSSSSSHYSSVNSGSISNISILSKDVLQNVDEPENIDHYENYWTQPTQTVNNWRHSDGGINFMQQIHEMARINYEMSVSNFNGQEHQNSFAVFPEVVVDVLEQQNSQPNLSELQKSNNFAHALMNLALLAANANQLKYLIETAENRPLFYISLAFIASSILIQILLKIFLMCTSRINFNVDDEARLTDRVNKFMTGVMVLIVLINFAVSFVVFLEMQPIFFE